MQLILTKKLQKTSFYSCVPLRSKIMSLQLRILNLSKFLFQKCKSWDLTGNTFLCVSSILIDPQRHTVPPFKDKFIINNSFYKIEAIRVKLQSLDFKTGPSILFVTPCITLSYLNWLQNCELLNLEVQKKCLEKVHFTT